MNTHKLAWATAGLLSLALVLFSVPQIPAWMRSGSAFHVPPIDRTKPLFILPLEREVLLGGYYEYMDSLAMAYDTMVTYDLSEHLLVHANPWIIDTLAGTDYYTKKEEGVVVKDSKQLTILSPDDTLYIPSETVAAAIQSKINALWLDINIPEFKLRIMQDSMMLHTFPVRVGQRRKRFLAMAGNEVDLRTRRGQGKIVRINKDPWFINPVDNKRYKDTRRDDRKKTELPIVPWLEPEINGKRHGQLIHPTTNPVTLGKAYSNGCIGTDEGAGWIIYYHAPLGTKVNVRYELMITDEITGDTIILKDIYHLLDERA